MNRSPVSKYASLAAIAFVSLVGAGTTRAAEQPSETPPSKEMREKMATLHERMAACLRSERTFQECREEMQKNCSNMMGERGCMMGMEHRRGMMPPPQDK